MRRGQQDERSDDDLWRGSRFIIAMLVILLAVVIVAVVRAGGSSGADPGPGLNVLVASYDLSIVGPQRFVVGLVTNDEAVVSHGEARLVFSYLGDDGAPARLGGRAVAAWQPIPGGDSSTSSTPVVGGANGVYVARGVDFDEPGFWQVDASIDVGGDHLEAEAAFEVLARPKFPAVGEAAPRTVTPLAGDAGISARIIDSRADPAGPVPDPAMHQVTVADAIRRGRPTMVIVSTPIYCISRFCGPLTEAVEALAAKYGDAMSFVHLEVWRDFDAQELNPGAAEWIEPPGAEEAKEPWIWVLDRDGVIVQRFDDIASEQELDDAAREVLR